MASSIGFLKCVGWAVLKAAIKAIPFGEFVVEIATEAYQEWSKQTDEPERRVEIEALAIAGPAEVRAQVEEVVREIGAGQPESVRQSVTAYLTQLPDAIRQSQRRPQDPSGRSVAPFLSLWGPEDLIDLLPTKLPRFKAGDRPPGIGDWELEELLGTGGFGEVWKARNPPFDPVALKFCLDAQAAETLRHEASVLGRVMQQGKHPGIVQLKHTYLSAKPPCLEYELVAGGNLAGYAQELLHTGQLTATKASRLVLELAQTVAFAHKASPPIVHRDLKPANVLVQRLADGNVQLRITDFGIGGAAATQAIDEARGVSAGYFLATALRGAHTPLYASPQQISRALPDPRDDVHALGIIWYQLVTGNLGMTAMPSDWREEVQERGLSEELTKLLAACIASKAEKRPASAVELAEGIQGLIKNEPGRVIKPFPDKGSGRMWLRGEIEAKAKVPFKLPRPGGLKAKTLELLTDKPQTMKQLMARGLWDTNYDYLNYLCGRGIVEKTAEGYKWVTGGKAIVQAAGLPAPAPEGSAKKPPATVSSKEDAEARLIERLCDLAPNRQWVESYFDLARQLVEVAGLGPDDPRLVMSIPQSQIILPISINSRYVLAASQADEGQPGHAILDLILPASMKDRIDMLPGVIGHGPFKPSFTGETADNVPLFVNLSVPSNFDLGPEVLEGWKQALLAERDHGQRSRFRKSHEPVVYDAATDPQYRRLLLDRVTKKKVLEYVIANYEDVDTYDDVYAWLWDVNGDKHGFVTMDTPNEVGKALGMDPKLVKQILEDGMWEWLKKQGKGSEQKPIPQPIPPIIPQHKIKIVMLPGQGGASTSKSGQATAPGAEEVQKLAAARRALLDAVRRVMPGWDVSPDRDNFKAIEVMTFEPRSMEDIREAGGLNDTCFNFLNRCWDPFELVNKDMTIKPYLWWLKTEDEVKAGQDYALTEKGCALKKSPAVVSGKEDAETRLIERLRLAPDREWAESYLDLARQLVEVAGLGKDDPRLVMSIPQSGGLPITINSRYVLVAFRAVAEQPGHAILELILPAAMKDRIDKLPGEVAYAFSPSYAGETEDNAPLYVSFSVPSRFDFAPEVLKGWRQASLAECGHGQLSRFRRFHEPVVYDAVTDLQFRGRLLDRAFPDTGRGTNQ
jgi:serine/threonine protein kinase